MFIKFENINYLLNANKSRPRPTSNIENLEKILFYEIISLFSYNKKM